MYVIAQNIYSYGRIQCFGDRKSAACKTPAAANQFPNVYFLRTCLPWSKGVPRQRPYCHSGLATLPSVGANQLLVIPLTVSLYVNMKQNGTQPMFLRLGNQRPVKLLLQQITVPVIYCTTLALMVCKLVTFQM